MNNLLKIGLTLFLLCLIYFCKAQPDNTFYAHDYIDQAEKYSAYLNYGEAIRYYEAGINIFIDTFDKNHPLVNINYVAIGKNYLETYDLEKAKLYCNNAFKNIEENFPNSAISAQCLACLGKIAQTEIDYSAALAYYEKAAVIQVQLWGENHYASSELYLLFGYFYLENNQLQQALSYFEQVKILNKKNIDLQQIYYTAQAYEAIGDWYFQQNNLEKAAISFNQSIPFYEKVNGDKHPTIATVHLKLGNIFYQKNKLDKAIETYNLSYASFQNYDLKSLEIEGYDTCRCNQILIDGVIGKAEIYQQKYAMTQQQNNLQLALKYYQEAAKKINLSVQFFAKDASHRQQILHQNKSIFVEAIANSYQLYEGTNDKKYIQIAFDLMNNYKALTLQIEQRESKILQAGIPKNIRQEQEAWKTKIADLKSEIYEAEMNNAANLTLKKQDLLNAMVDQATFSRAFENDYWYVKDSIFNNKSVNLQRLSTTLNLEAVLLNYVLDKKNNQVLIFIISNKNVVFRTVAIPENFIKSIEKFYRLLQSSLLTRADKKQQFIQKGNELYRYLIEPINDLLINKKRLIIIRDDVLNLIPFDALLKNPQVEDFQNLAYLIKDFGITYHYSTELWQNSVNQQWQGKTNSLLAFAPIFDDAENVKLSVADNTFRYFIQDEIQVSLPYSEREVTAIHQALGTLPENTVLLKTEATKIQLLQQLKKQHRFVHIASHSFANYDNALFSGIACFINPNSSTKEYMLYINEIENLDIQTDLVVLSSCESGIGQLVRGEGLLGINRSFLYAGVPNTLFSLWKVQDEATALLMIEFYKNVQNNMDYTIALQQAKLTLLQNEKTAIPNFWASFILMGR